MYKEIKARGKKLLEGRESGPSDQHSQISVCTSYSKWDNFIIIIITQSFDGWKVKKHHIFTSINLCM